MSLILLPRNVFWTADQTWAWSTGNKLAFAFMASVVALGFSMTGFHFTSNFGLPPEKHGGKVNNFAHKFFAVTLGLSGAAAAASFLGAGYCCYVYNKI